VNIKYLKNWVFFLAVLLFSVSVLAKEAALSATIAVTQLPREAQQTLALIKQGGPFPYPKDGATFGNYEKTLPIRKRGYYREYTVRTPGASNRGARRIIVGGVPATSGEYYYTADHYTTFRRIQE
jgi:ribonuclease T1